MARVRAAKLSSLPGIDKDFVAWAKTHDMFPYCDDLASTVSTGNSAIIRDMYIRPFGDEMARQ